MKYVEKLFLFPERLVISGNISENKFVTMGVADDAVTEWYRPEKTKQLRISHRRIRSKTSGRKIDMGEDKLGITRKNNQPNRANSAEILQNQQRQKALDDMIRAQHEFEQWRDRKSVV